MHFDVESTALLETVIRIGGEQHPQREVRNEGPGGKFDVRQRSVQSNPTSSINATGNFVSGEDPYAIFDIAHSTSNCPL